ncbi:MAG: hypothetical protein ACTHOO_11230 [Alcanivorax sp.]
MKKLLMLSALALAVSVPTAAEAGPHGGKKGHKMFEKHDLNGDGVVTKSEFLEGAEKMFSKMDLDGNGEITKEEAEEARAKMKEKWKEHKGKKGGHGDAPPEGE